MSATKKKRSSGNVFILSKNLRGPWAPYKDLKSKIEMGGGQFMLLDVTSASKKYRDHFSPMKRGARNGFCCFENWWQSGKLYRGMDRTKQINWWKKQVKGKRRYPGSKGKAVLGASWPEFGDRVFDYESS